MKQQIIRKLFFYSLVIFLFLSCEKDPSNKDFIAKWGIFKCDIDDKEFYPSTTLGGSVNPINVYYCPTGSQGYFKYPPGFLSIQGIDARYSLDIAGDICIQKTDVFDVGKYALTYQDCEIFYACDASWYYKSNEWDYFTQEGNYFEENGQLTITKFDTIERRISGTFYFDVKDVKDKKRKLPMAYLMLNTS